MIHLIDKDALVVEIENRIKRYTLLQQKPQMSDLQEELQSKIDCLNSIKGYILNALEVKEVVVEQEGTCNGIFNRIVGNNCNISIPLGKVGLKHGDKVKIFATKEK